MTSLDINANHGEAKDDEVEIPSMKKVTRRKSRNSCEYDDFGLIEVHNCLIYTNAGLLSATLIQIILLLKTLS